MYVCDNKLNTVSPNKHGNSVTILNISTSAWQAVRNLSVSIHVLYRLVTYGHGIPMLIRTNCTSYQTNYLESYVSHSAQ